MDRAAAYIELGLAPGASPDAITAAFHALAKQHHPSSHMRRGDGGARWTRLKQAVEILRAQPAPQAGARIGTTWSPATSGTDIEAGVEVDMDTLVLGGEIDVEVAAPRDANAGHECASCGGTGRSSASKGIIRVRIDCPHCAGRGHVLGPAQDGPTRTLKVVIAALTPPGTVLRLVAKGNPGSGGHPPGDLLISLKPARRANCAPLHNGDVLLNVEVGFAALCMGEHISVTGLAGEQISLDVPPGHPAAGVIRIPGHGLAQGAGRRGQLHLRLMPRIPTSLDARQRGLLKLWSELESGHGT